MRRREFITVLGGAVTAPIVRWREAHAQQSGKITPLGVLGRARNSPVQEGFYQAFLAQLREHGFRDGHNVAIEYQAADDARGIVVSAADMLRTQPELIIVSGPEVALQARKMIVSPIPPVGVSCFAGPVEQPSGVVLSLWGWPDGAEEEAARSKREIGAFKGSQSRPTHRARCFRKRFHHRLANAGRGTVLRTR